MLCSLICSYEIIITRIMNKFKHKLISLVLYDTLMGINKNAYEGIWNVVL